MVFVFEEGQPINLAAGESMARNYLITGEAGFIGSNYVHRLVERGENVTIDNLSRAGAPEYCLAGGNVREKMRSS